MKKKIILGLLLAAVLILPMILTGCKPVSGIGVFQYNVSSSEYINIKYNIEAEASGDHYKYPIYNGTNENSNFQYIYFQPAQGQFTFSTSNGIKIQGNFNGTFYLSKPVDEVFPGIPDDYKNSTVYVGRCKVTQSGVTNSYYLVALFAKNTTEFNGSDAIVIQVFQSALFVNGKLPIVNGDVQMPTQVSGLNFSGPVISGNLVIGQNGQGQNSQN